MNQPAAHGEADPKEGPASPPVKFPALFYVPNSAGALGSITLKSMVLGEPAQAAASSLAVSASEPDFSASDIEARVREQMRFSAGELHLARLLPPEKIEIAAEAATKALIAVLTGRESEPEPAAEVAAVPSWPASWEAAKTQVPELIHFTGAKSRRPEITIIDHLRDRKEGYGFWTLNPPGLPRKVLKDIGDSAAYTALYAYCRPLEPGGEPTPLPKDLYLPTWQDQLASEEIDEDQVRQARRLIRRWERTHKNLGSQD